MSLDSVRSTFSIKDLENFSGIKAHTLRVWERRYNLFSPDRTEGNQRSYNLANLQKLLNIKLLYEDGTKISKIAAYSDEELPEHVLRLIIKMKDSHQAIDMLKMAMLEFDQHLFEKTYLQLISNLSFRRVFLDVFIPLLEHIGFLWQVDAISPSHEHFITSLIQQKVLSNIERIQTIPHHRSDQVFVLYLPYGEIHDLGLLYLHYELILRGYKSIYLGQSMPLDSLIGMHEVFAKITYASYFTVRPSKDELKSYCERVKNELLARSEDEMWILGRMVLDIDSEVIGPRAHLFGKLTLALDHISNQ